MHAYHYILVNVFAETHFGGNPLAVFPYAQGLNTSTMQQIARQMNLSECAFLFPPENAHTAARLRIFTPTYEMPFAGHPTLGAAFVVQQQTGAAEFMLQTNAQTVAISGEDGVMSFQVPSGKVQAAKLNAATLTQLTGLPASELANDAYWVNTGTTQLLLQCQSSQAVAQAQIDLATLRQVCHQAGELGKLYLWHDDGEHGQVRLFVDFHGLTEDSGTGSACANLGSLLAWQKRAPLQRILYQGDHLGRPNRLYLNVSEQNVITVGGRVIPIGAGHLNIPSNLLNQ